MLDRLGTSRYNFPPIPTTMNYRYQHICFIFHNVSMPGKSYMGVKDEGVGRCWKSEEKERERGLGDVGLAKSNRYNFLLP